MEINKDNKVCKNCISIERWENQYKIKMTTCSIDGHQVREDIETCEQCVVGEIDLNNITEDDCRLLEVISWQGKVVRHFKGGFYLIIDVHARHTETNERMIYYRALYGECKSHVRPANMFIEKCSAEEYKQYGQEYRFESAELYVQKEMKAGKLNEDE